MAKTETSQGQNLKLNEKKWSKDLMDAGWTVIPNVFLERQRAFGFDAIDMNILMHLASFWWHPENKPHPSKKSIAQAMDIDPRTVQRRIAKMEKLGFIDREQRRISKVGSKSNIYHLDKLIAVAKPYARQIIEQKKDKAAAREAMRARRGRPALKLVTNYEDSL